MRAEKYLRTARRIERMDLLSTTDSRRIVKCLYRKTLWVVERLVTTNVKGASSPRMLSLERRERREEKVQGTPAGSSGLLQTTDGERRLRGGECCVVGPLPGLGLPSFGCGMGSGLAVKSGELIHLAVERQGW